MKNYFNLSFSQKHTQPTSKTKAIIEQIHREFNSVGEDLLKQAESVLTNYVVKNTAKVQILRTLGFNNVPEVKEITDLETRKELAEETAKLINSYKIKYPLQRLITEEAVGRICKKYNLVCGDVSLYKGFVPLKNAEEILRFKLKDEDICVTGRSWGMGSGLDRPLINVSLNIFNKAKHYYDGNGVWCKGEDIDILGEYFDNVKPSTLKICAPLKDMDTKGMNLEGYHLEKHIHDPVILQPVIGGYLIISAWGDESSDEDVVNSINN